MKNSKSLIGLFIIITIFFSGNNKEVLNSDLEKICNAKPKGWECKIGEDNIESYIVNFWLFPDDLPSFIIKYKNENREFKNYNDVIKNPSLLLLIYPISEKDRLVSIIKSSILYSTCVPVYYGETQDFFIITSPCYINGGSFSDESKSSIKDLHQSLENVLTIKDYGKFAESFLKNILNISK